MPLFSFSCRLQMLCGSAALLLVSISFAQNSAPGPLTLADALQRASTQNPRLAAFGYAENAAEASIEQASQRPAPTLGITAENVLGTGAFQGVDRSETTLQYSQTIERGGKLGKRTTLANQERNNAVAEFAVHRNAVLTTTATAYTATLAAQQRLTLSADAVQQAQAVLTSLTSGVQSGANAPIEAARARIARISAQADYAQDQSRLTCARAMLAASWGGTPADLPAQISGQLQVPESLPSIDTFLPQLTQHPRIAQQHALIASRRAALQLAHAQTVPDVTASGGLRYYREDSDTALVLGISVPLPMKNYNQGNLRAARATLAGAEQTLLAVESELRAEFSAAWTALQSAHATVLALRQDALPATEEAFNLARQAHAEGQIPLYELLETRRTLNRLHQDLMSAEATYLTSLTALEALTDSTFSQTIALISTP